MNVKMNFDSNLRKREKSKKIKSKSKAGTMMAGENWGAVVVYPAPVTRLPENRELGWVYAAQPGRCPGSPPVTTLSQMNFPNETPSTGWQPTEQTHAHILAAFI